MKVTKRFVGFALLANIFLMSACSQQMPTTSSNQNSSQTQTSSNSSLSVDSSTDINEIQSYLSDDEETAKDSEIIADGQAGFQTKAILNGNLKFESNLKGKISKEERQQIINDRQKVLNARIKLVDTKLKLYKDVAKALTDKVTRKDVFIRTSDVVEVKNDDSTTTKIINIRFENKADATIYRENKISKTFSADGQLIKIEHIITANMKNHTRNYTKFVDVSSDGSRNAVINSIIKWDNGRIRTVNETRTISADGSGTGEATITVTTANGETKSYNVTTNITATGNITTQPAS